MLPETIQLRVKDKIENMPKDQFVRWACLVEALDVISEQCDKLKLPRSDTSWIKPNAIGKYIGDRNLSMEYQLNRELARA